MNRVALTNLGKYNEGELRYVWLSLPYDEDHLEKALKRIGIDGIRYEEVFITDFENDIGFEIGEYMYLPTLNELFKEIDMLDEHDTLKLKAMLEGHGMDIDEAISKLEDSYLYEDIANDKELGEYMFNEYEYESIAERLLFYIDYEAYGRDYRIQDYGVHTDYGYIQVNW